MTLESNTLKEIMSENITTSEHTVFYLVHKHMETVNRIDQPIKFVKPKVLRNSLLKIQQHYQLIVEYIKDFDRHMKGRRAGAIKMRKELLGSARQRTEAGYDGGAQSRHREDQERRPSSSSDENGTLLPPKRRRFFPKRLNIASAKGPSYE